jgi:hypothetical protein
MKTMKTTLVLLLVLMVSGVAFSQTSKNDNKQKQETMNTKTMNTYVIEREIPEAGKLKAEDLQGISKTSCSVLKELGPDIQWLHSYVTDNKIFCVYKAENEEILKTHAKKGGFPINSIHKLSTVISPETATAPLADIIVKE